MILPDNLPVFGDREYRGTCPVENADQVTLFAFIRRQWPKTWGVIAFHPRNEGKRSWGQAAWQRAEGMTEGTVDLIIPARVPLVMELKRKDHTKSKWQPGQAEYLTAAQDAGAFACIALGCEAAIEAVKTWADMVAR
jgi:hypothetical protein